MIRNEARGTDLWKRISAMDRDRVDGRRAVTLFVPSFGVKHQVADALSLLRSLPGGRLGEAICGFRGAGPFHFRQAEPCSQKAAVVGSGWKAAAAAGVISLVYWLDARLVYQTNEVSNPEAWPITRSSSS